MSFEKLLQNIGRRNFLKIVSFTGITGLIYPRKLLSSYFSTTLSPVGIKFPGMEQMIPVDKLPVVCI